MKGKPNRKPSHKLLQRVARNIRRIRKSRGLGQERLAFTACVDRVTVNEIEKCRVNATIATLEALAKALQCDVEDFYARKRR
jgi:transcriptional regulator with XRE-family HTH domain